MQIVVNGRYIITNKTWGKGIFEVYIDEISPSGEWVKIMETGLNTKDKKRPSRWYKKSEIVFHEELTVPINEPDDNILDEIKEQIV